MSKVIRLVTRVAYRGVAKPVMFRQSPDKIHHGLIKTSRRVQKLPGIRSLPKLWSYQNRMLEQNIAGVDFRNPIGLSAGFDKTIETVGVMRSVGFGWMTGGSVTLGEYEGNPRPWFHRLPKNRALLVNAGLPSEGTEVVSARVASYNPRLFAGFPLNISVAKTNSVSSVGDKAGIDDYCQSLAVFDGIEQVSTLEINISCPNTFGGEPFTTAERLEKLLKAVDKLKLTKPVFIKMPISLSLADFDSLLSVIVKHRIAGVAVGNLLKDRKLAHLKEDLSDEVKGNISGLPNKDISTNLVRRVYKKYGQRLIIIGIGGVTSAEDAYEKICAGASLVGLITGLIYEGPQLVGEINSGLVKLLKKDGFSSISEAIGSEFRR